MAEREREDTWAGSKPTFHSPVCVCVCVCCPQVCLRNSLRDRHRPMRKEVVVTLDTPLRPLDEKDLMMIRTLGPKPTAAPPTSTSRWSWTKLVEPLSDAR